MVHRSYAAAIEAYQRDPQRSAVLSNKIGVAYHHMFALDQARKYYQLALAMNPDVCRRAQQPGRRLPRSTRIQASGTHLQAGAQVCADAAITYCNLGTSYFAEEKYKPGMEAYHKALALNPNIFDPGQVQIVQETSSRRQLVAVNYYLAKTYATRAKCRNRSAICARRWKPASVTESS